MAKITTRIDTPRQIGPEPFCIICLMSGHTECDHGTVLCCHCARTYPHWHDDADPPPIKHEHVIPDPYRVPEVSSTAEPRLQPPMIVLPHRADDAFQAFKRLYEQTVELAAWARQAEARIAALEAKLGNLPRD